MQHLNEIKNKRILLGTLNWGMGHVSRCIPIVQQLLDQGNTVIIGANVAQKKVFKAYFPEIRFIKLARYPFKFNGKGNFAWDLFLSYRALKRRREDEEMETANWVDELKIDLVISDERYGLWTDKVPSVLITHQGTLPLPWYLFFIQKLHLRLLKRFDTIWMLDDHNHQYAGKLSESPLINVIYCGIKSRFSLYTIPKEKKYEEVAVVSGPNVYAQQFYDEMIRRNPRPEKIIIPDSILEDITITETVVAKNWKEIDEILIHAKKIISRSGYSTWMDVNYLKCAYEFSPTPGQAEQLYLNLLIQKKDQTKSATKKRKK